jgi:hypothetical protein
MYRYHSGLQTHCYQSYTGCVQEICLYVADAVKPGVVPGVPATPASSPAGHAKRDAAAKLAERAEADALKFCPFCHRVLDGIGHAFNWACQHLHLCGQCQVSSNGAGCSITNGANGGDNGGGNGGGNGGVNGGGMGGVRGMVPK